MIAIPGFQLIIRYTDEPEDASVTISQAVTQTNTGLTGPFWAINSYSDKRDVKDDRFDYRELVRHSSSNFPTAIVIIVEERTHVTLCFMKKLTILNLASDEFLVSHRRWSSL